MEDDPTYAVRCDPDEVPTAWQTARALEGWGTLASHGFLGAVYVPAKLGAFLRSWHERFGAELMANWVTMLEP